MDWIIKMNDAITYIESKLTNELNAEIIAKTTGMSPYHFQRMFAVMTGVSLTEYIRRRRMTLAVAELRAGKKIIDVALAYQYNSPTAFNRAFQQVHGVAPSLVKHGGVTLKSYQPLQFQMVVRGVESLEYRIEDKPAFQVIGASIELFGDMSEMEEPIAQFWNTLEHSGKMATIRALAPNEPLYEVMIPDETSEHWQYLLGVKIDAHTPSTLPDHLETYTVAPYTWAVFNDQATTMEELTKDGGVSYRAIKEWLPTSEYEYAKGPDIQVWTRDDENRVEMEFWLPVRLVSTKNQGRKNGTA